MTPDARLASTGASLDTVEQSEQKWTFVAYSPDKDTGPVLEYTETNLGQGDSLPKNTQFGLTVLSTFVFHIIETNYKNMKTSSTSASITRLVKPS